MFLHSFVCLWGGGGGASSECIQGEGMHPSSAWMHQPPHLRKTDGQQAGDTHPTGMHTCLIGVYDLLFQVRRKVCLSGLKR